MAKKSQEVCKVNVPEDTYRVRSSRVHCRTVTLYTYEGLGTKLSTVWDPRELTRHHSVLTPVNLFWKPETPSS